MWKFQWNFHAKKISWNFPSLSLVLIAPTHGGMARLSLPGWPVTYRDCLPAGRRSPIQVLTGPDLQQVRLLPLMDTNEVWTTTKPNRYRRRPDLLFCDRTADESSYEACLEAGTGFRQNELLRCTLQLLDVNIKTVLFQSSYRLRAYDRWLRV